MAIFKLIGPLTHNYSVGLYFVFSILSQAHDKTLTA